MNQLGATGAAVLWAVGRERSFGVPGGEGLTAYKAVLPIDSDLLDAESESAAVNQSGFLERGIPGPKGGKSTWSTSLTTGSLLDFLEHLLGQVTKTPLAGPVHVQVSRVAGGLQFKTEQTPNAPAFPGAAVDVALDAAGEAIWQNLQGADGLDLGFWEENRDPLEIVWPGTAADHAALAVGDVFTFQPPGQWTEPAIPPLTGHQRFTSAHWTVALRTVGAATWTPMSCRKGELALSWPISEERGNGSRYPYALLRDGLFSPSLKIERALVDSFFADRAETAARLEAQLAFTGRQLDTTTRESITFHFASARIDAAKRTAKDARTIPEEITLVGETTDTLTPPLTVEVITTRDWSPAA